MLLDNGAEGPDDSGLEPDSGHDDDDEEARQPAPGSPLLGESEQPEQALAANPWSLQCLRRQAKDGGLRRLYPCIFLEDLCRGFRRPCILDLKMGTRSHADDASPQKRARHMAKCRASTSLALGLRLCGMQVYDAAAGAFRYQDKYYGRALQVADVPAALFRFLLWNWGAADESSEESNAAAGAHDNASTPAATSPSPSDSDSEPASSAAGAAAPAAEPAPAPPPPSPPSAEAQRRMDKILESFLAVLPRVRQAVASARGIRFYSSSLLLIYEGDLACPPRTDMRMIDFAHTCQYTGDSEASRKPDEVGVCCVRLVLCVCVCFF